MAYISIKSVTKTYGKKSQKFTALDDVSIEIEKGDSVAIVGKSGSGKSTLMHAISGLDKPEIGEIIVDGQNILKLKKKKTDIFRNQTIGFIFQAFFIQPNESCYFNVAVPLEIAGVAKSKRKKLVEKALKEVDLIDKENSKAKNLSGGQKQRLAIARAIVNKPEIVFADEPTGNLDSVTGQAIEDLLFELNKKKGVTLIIVTHDQDLAARCNKIINIKDGKIISNPAVKARKQYATNNSGRRVNL
jgi:putative ABC transport system ATP-binding protein